MKKNYLLAVILTITLLFSLGIGAFMDAAAEQLQIDTPTLKPTTKATDTPPPKLTNTPTDTPTTTPTIKPTLTPPTKWTNTPKTP